MNIDSQVDICRYRVLVLTSGGPSEGGQATLLYYLLLIRDGLADLKGGAQASMRQLLRKGYLSGANRRRQIWQAL